MAAPRSVVGIDELQARLELMEAALREAAAKLTAPERDRAQQTQPAPLREVRVVDVGPLRADEPAAKPPVRESGPVEGAPGEPGGSPGAEEVAAEPAAKPLVRERPMEGAPGEGIPGGSPADEEVAAEPELEPELKPEPEPKPEQRLEEPDAHLLFVPTADGYELVQREGAVPHAGEIVELGDPPRRYAVTRVAPSPLPDDSRRCAYVQVSG